MDLTLSSWAKKDYDSFIKYLMSLQDINYQQFHSKIIKKDINIIGIKTDVLRKISKEIFKGNYQQFLNLVTFNYYEESIIYAFIISNIKTLNNQLINYIDIYKTKIDNWANCDLFCSSLKIVKKNKDYFYKYIKNNINNKEEYIKRMCIALLLNYYVEEKYLDDIFNICNNHCNYTYYVDMSIAWLISICYIKYKKQTISYLKNNTLNTFTHNKAISKIKDSYRVSKEEKIYLNTLKN